MELDYIIINFHHNKQKRLGLLLIPASSKIKCPINLLKTERRPLHLKTQSVPRCKHFSSRL
jgi:hypothetical protein